MVVQLFQSPDWGLLLLSGWIRALSICVGICLLFCGRFFVHDTAISKHGIVVSLPVDYGLSCRVVRVYRYLRIIDGGLLLILNETLMSHGARTVSSRLLAIASSVGSAFLL